MTAIPIIKTETTSSDSVRVGDRVARVLAAVPCPHCLRGRLHASTWRETGDDEFALTCPQCHRDVFTLTRS